MKKFYSVLLLLLLSFVPVFGALPFKSQYESFVINSEENIDTDLPTATIGEPSKVHADENNGNKTHLNLRPIVGILSQEPSFRMRKALTSIGLNATSYIAASYVKSVESAGARVVPILINQPDEYYRKLASSLNGILFPGGAVSISNASGYGRAGDILFELVMDSQSSDAMDPVPLWATCLGFEMLVYLAAGRQNPLTRCQAQNRADPLHFTDNMDSSKLFSTAPKELIESAKKNNITSNFHKYCVTPQTFVYLGLNSSYNIVSTNVDDKGSTYVSTIEHKHMPIFGTQWHPEKAPFEWKKSSIPHSPDAVQLHHHMMKVFVSQARLNMNSFASFEEEEVHLIYNYEPIYTANLYNISAFQQCYFF